VRFRIECDMASIACLQYALLLCAVLNCSRLIVSLACDDSISGHPSQMWISDATHADLLLPCIQHLNSECIHTGLDHAILCSAWWI